MKFSEILGGNFHHIILTKENQFFIDLFFTAAAHHFARMKSADPGSTQEEFHEVMYGRHLYRMMEIVYVSGDFRKAIDPTGQNLHMRQNWHPEKSRSGLPDPRMFNAMTADSRFALGMPHITDQYLHRKLDIPVKVLLKEWNYIN